MPACAGIWPALTAVFSVHMLGYHYGIAQYVFLILITLVVSVGTVGVQEQQPLHQQPYLRHLDYQSNWLSYSHQSQRSLTWQEQ